MSVCCLKLPQPSVGGADIWVMFYNIASVGGVIILD